MKTYTTEDKKVYAKLLDEIAIDINTNRTPYNIARLKEFVEVINLRIEGANYEYGY